MTSRTRVGRLAGPVLLVAGTAAVLTGQAAANEPATAPTASRCADASSVPASADAADRWLAACAISRISPMVVEAWAVQAMADRQAAAVVPAVLPSAAWCTDLSLLPTTPDAAEHWLAGC